MQTADRTLGHRAPLLWLVLPFMAGLAGARELDGFPLRPLPAGTLLGGALLAAAVAAAAGGRAPRAWSAAVVAAMACAGGASYRLHRSPLPIPSQVAAGTARRAVRKRSPTRPGRPDGAERRPYPIRNLHLSLAIERVFPPEDRAKTVSGIATIAAAGGPGLPWVGRRGYFTAALASGQQPPARSAVIAVVAGLSPVRRGAPASTFEGYLDGLGLDFRLLGARMIGEERPASAYARFCDGLAGRMSELLGVGLERQRALSAAYRAMMLGRRRDLEPADKRLFLRAGAAHLFAINGVHIGVVALSLRAVLVLARCPAPLAGLATLGALWLDVDSTGASPSAVRAFLMAAALAAAGLLRRPANPLSVLAAAALPVLLADPLDFFSASFQLSYGVVAAIVLLGLPLGARLRLLLPPYPGLPRALWEGPVPAGARWRLTDRLHHRFRRIRGRARRHLLGALGVGAAAALSSAVTGVQCFRLLAPAGLVANLLLVPPASLAIASGFLSVALGLCGITAASRLFNSAAGVLIWMIEAAMRLMTAVPGSSLPARLRAEWIGPAAQAAFLAACLAGYGRGWRGRRGGFWPPIAVVAIALGYGVVIVR